ncbi:MAG: hypothetical protein GXP44_01785 [bacterium]|nr:hypothetical protein [bacterium]
MGKITQLFLKIGVIFALIAVFSLYGFYKARGFLAGPEVALNEPKDGQLLKNSFVKVSGEAKNIASIFLDGNRIFVNEKGFFEENLLLARGYNIIEVRAVDKFGKEVKKIREVVVR